MAHGTRLAGGKETSYKRFRAGFDSLGFHYIDLQAGSVNRVQRVVTRPTTERVLGRVSPLHGSSRIAS